MPWHKYVMVTIAQLNDGDRVWVTVTEQLDGGEMSQQKREAFFDASLLSRELCSWIDATTTSFSIRTTGAAVE